MKLSGAITIVVATAATAFAAPERVTVCSEIGNGFAIRHAQSVAETIFSTIDVRIDWHRPAACPGSAIQIEYSYKTPRTFMPEALAYAKPYEGVHIIVFYDRILERYGQAEFTAVLGHVMAHEITHILEGVKRHSDAGIMKAAFTPDDARELARHPMTFAAEDVDLIHQGVDARGARVAALRWFTLTREKGGNIEQIQPAQHESLPHAADSGPLYRGSGSRARRAEIIPQPEMPGR